MTTLTCDICHEPMTPDRGYIYGVHAKCAQSAINKAITRQR
jgi:hypothetical protein